MTEEEKKAIETTKTIIEFAGDSYIPKENRNALQTLLKLIDKQEEEIDTHIETENDYEHELARKDEEIEKLNEKISKAIGHIEVCKTTLGNYVLTPDETELIKLILDK